MQLYLIRHGETKWNQEKRYYGKSDILLNATGIQQSKDVGHLLKDIEFDQIYTSPLLRAKQTLDYFFEQKGETRERANRIIKETERLAEQSLGIFEGFTYKELKQKFPNELQQWSRDWMKGVPRGESFQQLYDRIIDFCEEELKLDGVDSDSMFLQFRNLESVQDKILMVSHEGVLRCLCIILLKMKPNSIWNFTFTQGTYSRIDIEDGVAIIRKINESGGI